MTLPGAAGIVAAAQAAAPEPEPAGPVTCTAVRIRTGKVFPTPRRRDAFYTLPRRQLCPGR
jgi:hypothetical protein